MQEVSDRILQRMNDLNIKQADIMRGTGAGRATVSSWVKGDTKPSGDYVAKVANVLKVRTDWLLTGKGEMTATVIGASNVRPAKTTMRPAPVLNRIRAGEFTAIGDNEYDSYLPVDAKYGDYVYWLEVKGDSMNPLFEEGDCVLINPEKQPSAGDYVAAVLKDSGEGTLKKYKPCGYDKELGRDYYQLVPLNEFYPTYDSRYHNFEVVGIVIEFRRVFK